jgi:hypothetical protein
LEAACLLDVARPREELHLQVAWLPCLGAALPVQSLTVWQAPARLIQVARSWNEQ